jgi:hypothetical protein
MMFDRRFDQPYGGVDPPFKADVQNIIKGERLRPMKGTIFSELIILLAVLGAFSFLFNFVWEAFHAVYLYKMHDFDAAKYIPMILYVSALDALIIPGMYLSVSLLWKDTLWLKTSGKRQILVFFVVGLAVAAFIEYRAVFILKRWSYNSWMPKIFGIGLSPLFQLSITGLVALWLTKRLLYSGGILRDR